MGSAPFEDGIAPPLAVFKIVVAGGFGAGKTTLVSAISEVRPLCTEELLTSASTGYDDLAGVEDKQATTVAMDFGRITFGSHLLLYLFGTPGQDRFWFMWDELSYGALGAVVLADTRRLADCFPSVDYFEKRQVPFVVAINCFDGGTAHDPEDVRIALDLDRDVPAISCDARQPDSVKQVLITLVEHVLASGLARGSPPRADHSARLAGERHAIPAGAGLPGTSGRDRVVYR
jgi:signal recognition particle receptor subunit beta